MGYVGSKQSYIDKKYKATAIPSVIDIAVKNLISERQSLLGLIARLTRVINGLSSIRDKLRR